MKVFNQNLLESVEKEEFEKLLQKAQEAQADEQAELNAEDENTANQLNRIFYLAKQYLKLLIAISKHRTQEITRKFFQLEVVQFLTREIDLEYNVSQIRDRFMRIRKEHRQGMMAAMSARNRAGDSLLDREVVK